MGLLDLPSQPPQEYHCLKLQCFDLQFRARIKSERSLLSEEPGAASLHICFWIVAVPMGVCCCFKQLVFTVPLLCPLMTRLEKEFSFFSLVLTSQDSCVLLFPPAPRVTQSPAAFAQLALI